MLRVSERWLSKRQKDLTRELDWDTFDEQQEKKEEEEALKASQQLPSEPVVVGKIMTKEERTLAMKDLIDRIPADKEGLWRWPIKWEYLTKSLLESKLKPFISKKVLEYLGAEESDLVDFVSRVIAGRSTAEAVVVELKTILDEDAEMFVMKLWRMLVYETEARAKGIV